MQDFVERVPPAAAVAADMEGVLHRGGNLLRYKMNVVKAAALCYELSTSGRQSSLKQCLDTDWAAKHACIVHDDCPTINDGDAEARPTRGQTKRPPCFEVGFFICSASSEGLYRLRGSFHRQLKAAFSKAAGSRQPLEDKFVVARLHGHRDGAESEWD